MFEGKPAGARSAKLTAERSRDRPPQAGERPLNKRLTSTEAALEIMGKAHALLESLSERGARNAARDGVDGHLEYPARNGITTRAASALTGMHRSTALRRAAPNRPTGAAGHGAGQQAHRRRVRPGR